MLRFHTAAMSWSAGLAVLLTAGSASAQWYARASSPCDCAPATHAAFTASAPMVTSVSACAPVVQTVCAPPVQPVMQTVYKQVPTIEYHPVKQTVKKPIVQTAYVDQPVTEYHPVVETRTVDVPTVSYQDVQECQTSVKNMGYWRQQYQPVLKPAPCQIDQTPGFMGWMNRTGQEMRNAFTPNYRVQREYVPQTVVQTSPVTRRVAIQGTKQVAYNVTSMVPYQTTRKVAVNTTAYVDEEVTVMKPTTVVKTVAVGSQISYAPIAPSGSATALQPQPDNIGANPLTPTSRSAQGNDKLKQANPNNALDPRRGSLDVPPTLRTKLVPTSLPQPPEREVSLRPRAVADRRDERLLTIPTAARLNQWVARTPTAPAPDTAPSAIVVADVDRP